MLLFELREGRHENPHVPLFRDFCRASRVGFRRKVSGSVSGLHFAARIRRCLMLLFLGTKIKDLGRRFVDSDHFPVLGDWLGMAWQVWLLFCGVIVYLTRRLFIR